RRAIAASSSVVEGDGLVVARVGAEGYVACTLTETDLLANLLGDLDHDLQVLGDEGLGVLPALAELFALVGVPGAGLLDDTQVHGHVQQRPFPADAMAVHDVELGLAEWGRTLVLYDLHARAVPNNFCPTLDGFDPADVKAHRRIELEGPAAGGGFGAVVHHHAVSQIVMSSLDLDVKAVHAAGLGLGYDLDDRQGHQL